MHSKSKKTVLPQIFVNGEFKGLVRDLEDANECDDIYEWINAE